MTYPAESAAARGLARCHSCGHVEPVEAGHCPRCHAPLHLRNVHSLQHTIALSIASTLLYFPANLLPVLRVQSSISGASQNTILSGVVQFWEDGDYPVAVIIFTASVMIPILKLLAITTLCFGACTGKWPRAMTRLYRLTELIGRWSMVDVFVVAILVGVVQLGSVLAIDPGPGAFAFAGVVVLTMLAAHAFDPRLIWDAAARNPAATESETSPGNALNPATSSSHV